MDAGGDVAGRVRAVANQPPQARLDVAGDEEGARAAGGDGSTEHARAGVKLGQNLESVCGGFVINGAVEEAAKTLAHTSLNVGGRHWRGEKEVQRVVRSLGLRHAQSGC